jgi:hypothetical protein
MAKSANKSSTAHRRQSKTGLTPPRVDSIIDLSDGTLKREVVDDDLPVEVDKWLNAYAGDGVQLQLEIEGAWTNVGAHMLIDDDTPFPLTLKLPKSYLAADAALQLRYKLTVDNPPDEGPSISLRVDRTPPWGRFTPDPLIIAETPVTDDYLAANPLGLAIELDPYDGQKDNDKVAVFYLNHVPDNPAHLPPPVLYVDVPNDRTLTIPVQAITDVGNGGCYALYILWDIAGNESKLSTYKSVIAALGKLPAGLSDPTVPKADPNSKLIDLNAARGGIDVKILAFENGDPLEDTFVLEWGDQSFEHPVAGQIPYLVPVPREVLKAAYGTGPAPVDTTVSYRVKRGGLAIPTPPDPARSTLVKVDFSYIGPERPDPDPTWPHPENPNLSLCEIYAQGSSTPNELLKADNGKDATLKFELYTPANDGEQVKFFWDGEHVVEADYTVVTTHGPTISVTIPWKYINDAGNHPALPVHYEISAKDSTNAQHSPPTEVKVEAVILVAPTPTFQGLTPDGRLVCSSLKDPNDENAEPAFRLEVPNLSTLFPALSTGTEITLTWEPYRGLSGETPVPGDHKKVEIVKIDDDHPITGFVWRIEPYDDHILPIYGGVDNPRGRGKVFYSFTYKSEPVSSEPSFTIVNISSAGANGTCEL